MGAGLVVLGGLDARLAGTVKVGVHSFEFALQAKQLLVETQHRLEA